MLHYIHKFMTHENFDNITIREDTEILEEIVGAG